MCGGGGGGEGGGGGGGLSTFHDGKVRFMSTFF